MLRDRPGPTAHVLPTRPGGPPLDLRPLLEESGRVDPRIYVDPEVYELEQERVFGRNWLFLAHESQLQKPGDFITTYMGEDPIIVSRQDDGSVAAFLNQCRHRGMRLTQEDAGHTRVFTCTYHGWTYDRGGRLSAVRDEREIYRCPVDRDRWSAVRVPRVESWMGLVFGTWDEHAPSFRESLGDAAWYLEPHLDGVGGTEVLGVTKWTVHCNWKFGAEQFASDGYHFGMSHLSALKALMSQGPGGARSLQEASPPPDAGRQLKSVQGHGVITAVLPLDNARGVRPAFEPVANEWMGGPRHDFLVQKYGETRASVFVPVSNLFPNLGILPAASALRVWQPKGPEQMEVWSYVLVDVEAPAEVKQAIRRGNQRSFGAAGIFEQDDTHNWMQYALEQFLYAEAALLDEHRFEEWLGLFTPDVRYRVPARPLRATRAPRPEALEAPDGPAHFDDDLRGLSVRVARLTSGLAWSEYPLSHTRRLVSNVQARVLAEPGALEVRSAFLLFELEAGAATPLLSALSPAVPRSSRDSLISALRPSFQRACEDLVSGRSGAHALIHHVTQLLVIEWVRAAAPPLGGLADAFADPSIAAALALMHRQPGAPWTVDSLAERVALARTTFALRFARHVGESPFRYLTRCRIALATRLLQSTTLSLREVAARVGYADEATFHRAFKRETGTRPGEVRAARRGP